MSEKTRGGSGARAREEGTDGDTPGGEKLTDGQRRARGRARGHAPKGPEGERRGGLRGGLSEALDAAGTSPLGLGGGASMVKAHLRAWGTAPSSPLPKRGPGGRGQAVGWPRASRGPLSPLFPRLWTFSSLLTPEVMCGQCPAQSLSPHSSGSPLGQQAGGWGDRLQAPLFRACQKSWGPDTLRPPCCQAGQLAHAAGMENRLRQADQRTKSQVTERTTCRPAFGGAAYLGLGPASRLCPLGLAGGMTLPLPSHDHRFSVSASTSDSWEAALRRLLMGF